jgi:hypothetical protein
MLDSYRFIIIPGCSSFNQLRYLHKTTRVHLATYFLQSGELVEHPGLQAMSDRSETGDVETITRGDER